MERGFPTNLTSKDTQIFDDLWREGCILYLLDTNNNVLDKNKIMFSLLATRTGGFYETILPFMDEFKQKRQHVKKVIFFMIN